MTEESWSIAHGSDKIEKGVVHGWLTTGGRIVALTAPLACHLSEAKICPWPVLEGEFPHMRRCPCVCVCVPLSHSLRGDSLGTRRGGEGRVPSVYSVVRIVPNLFLLLSTMVLIRYPPEP